MTERTIERRHRQLAFDTVFPNVHHLTWWAHKWLEEDADPDNGLLRRVAQAFADRERSIPEQQWAALLDAARSVLNANSNVYRDEHGLVIPRDVVEGEALRRLQKAADAFPHPAAAALPPPPQGGS